MMILHVQHQVVSNSSDTSASIDIPSTIDNAQEYMVNKAKQSKMNLFVEDI